MSLSFDMKGHLQLMHCVFKQALNLGILCYTLEFVT
jgi:hypothetical protein